MRRILLTSVAVVCLSAGAAMADCAAGFGAACSDDDTILQGGQGGAGGHGGSAAAAAAASASNSTRVGVETKAYGGSARQDQGQHQGQGQDQGQGQHQSANNKSSISIDGDDDRSVAISAPALAAGANACAESFSAGGGAFGIGATVGASTSAEGCELRAKMATLAGLRLRDEAIRLGCLDDQMKQVLGDHCTSAATRSASVQSAASSPRQSVEPGTGSGDPSAFNASFLGLEVEPAKSWNR